MRSKKKALLIVACALMLALASVMGTLAWLTDKTDTVTNTFTVGKVDIELAEGENIANNLKMVPGFTITKDPKVTVKSGSEACYVFVKIEIPTHFDTYLTYEVPTSWTKLESASTDVALVYYQKVTNPSGTILEGNQVLEILKGNQVTVKGEVTSDQMAAADISKVTMGFTACAIQLYKNNNTEFTVEEAWDKLSGTTN